MNFLFNLVSKDLRFIHKNVKIWFEITRVNELLHITHTYKGIKSSLAVYMCLFCHNDKARYSNSSRVLYRLPIFGASKVIPYFSSKTSITDVVDARELKYFRSLLKYNEWNFYYCDAPR